MTISMDVGNVTGIGDLISYVDLQVDGAFINGLIIIIFLLVFILLRRQDTTAALMTASWITFILSGFLWFAELVPIQTPINLLIVTVLCTIVAFVRR